jgi:hypothetical protein
MQNTEQAREDGVQLRVLHRLHNYRVREQHVNLLRVHDPLGQHISFSPVSYFSCKSVSALRRLRPVLELVRPPLLLLRTAAFVEAVTGVGPACPHCHRRREDMLDPRLYRSKAAALERGLACLTCLRLMRRRIWPRAGGLAR